MEREKPSEATKWDVGMAVKSRHVGLGFPQMFGRVKKIEGNLMFVRWNGWNEDQVFDLTNTVHLHASIDVA